MVLGFRPQGPLEPQKTFRSILILSDHVETLWRNSCTLPELLIRGGTLQPKLGLGFTQRLMEPRSERPDLSAQTFP